MRIMMIAITTNSSTSVNPRPLVRVRSLILLPSDMAQSARRGRCDKSRPDPSACRLSCHGSAQAGSENLIIPTGRLLAQGFIFLPDGPRPARFLRDLTRITTLIGPTVSQSGPLQRTLGETLQPKRPLADAANAGVAEPFCQSHDSPRRTYYLRSVRPSCRRLFGAAAQVRLCRTSQWVTRSTLSISANAGFLDYSQTGNRIGCDMPAKRA